MKGLLKKLRNRYGASAGPFETMRFDDAFVYPTGYALFAAPGLMADSGIALITSAGEDVRKALLLNILRNLVMAERVPVLCCFRHLLDGDLAEGLVLLETGKLLTGTRRAEEYRKGGSRLEPYADGLVYSREISMNIKILERHGERREIGALVADDLLAVTADDGDPTPLLIGLKRFSTIHGVPLFLVLEPDTALERAGHTGLIESVINVEAPEQDGGPSPVCLRTEIRNPPGLTLNLKWRPESGLIENIE
jgi:hypothetical protein